MLWRADASSKAHLLDQVRSAHSMLQLLANPQSQCSHACGRFPTTHPTTEAREHLFHRARPVWTNDLQHRCSERAGCGLGPGMAVGLRLPMAGVHVAEVPTRHSKQRCSQTANLKRLPKWPCQTRVCQRPLLRHRLQRATAFGGLGLGHKPCANAVSEPRTLRIATFSRLWASNSRRSYSPANAAFACSARDRLAGIHNTCGDRATRKGTNRTAQA